MFELKKRNFKIAKSDEERHIVMGWANVSARADGTLVEDLQHDVIEPEELERAVYDYVLEFRDAGEEHDPSMRKKGRLVESVVFTGDKLKAMGIPDETVPYGWWVGFKIDDDDTWKRVKDGSYSMFSIEGTAVRVRSDLKKARTFSEVYFKTKMNSGRRFRTQT